MSIAKLGDTFDYSIKDINLHREIRLGYLDTYLCSVCKVYLPVQGRLI